MGTMNEFQQQHVLNIATNLQSLFSEDRYLDVTLSVQGIEFRSNSMLLCASSDYFRGLFQFYGIQNQKTLNSHYDLSSEYLSVRGLCFLIRFLNSLGQDIQSISKEDYEAVYAAASFLQVTSLQAMMSSLIEHNLDTSSVLETIRLANLFDDTRLYRNCMVMLLDKFHSVDVFSENYRNLSQEVIQEIFTSDRVNVPRESFMVKALLSWLCGDVQSRLAFFQNKFSQLLRLSLVGSDELKDILCDTRFEQVKDGLCLLQSAHPYLSNDLVGSCSTLDSSANKARSGTSFRIYSIGGVEDPQPQYSGGPSQTPEFFSYDCEMARISAHPTPCEAVRVYHAVACSLGWLYVTGGESEEGQLMSHCSKFNLLEHMWFQMSPLDSPRSHHSAVCIENFVYVFGGYRLNWITGYSPTTDSILIYDSTVNLWKPSLHRLPFAAVDMGSVLLPNRRMVVFAGGLHERGTEMLPSDSVVLYDPAEDHGSCFTLLPKMPIPLAGLSLTYDEMSDLVFVCGGKTDQAHSLQSRVITGQLSGQIFAFHFETRSWSFITMLDYPRYHCASFVSRSTLYVLGGITVDEVVESMALLTEADLATSSHSTGTDDNRPMVPHLSSFDMLYQSPVGRSVLLQTPYRTCHFVEAWQINQKTDAHMVDAGDNRFRLRRLTCRPARHEDNRLLLLRLLACYCLAPYFPPSSKL